MSRARRVRRVVGDNDWDAFSFSSWSSFSLGLDLLEMGKSIFVGADSDLGSDLFKFFVTVGLAKYPFASGGDVRRVYHLRWVVAKEGAEK